MRTLRRAPLLPRGIVAKRRTVSLSLAVAAGCSGVAWAQPSNQPPPSDPILDLNGGAIPHETPQTYTVDFTAGLSNTAITLAFREDPAFIFVFNTSVVDLTTSSGNRLTNGDFSGGTYTDNGNSATPTGWTYANIYGASAGGVVTSSCEGYGSHCWYDGAVQAYDAISQTISTTVGDRYQVSFSATDNSDLTNWSRVSTNGDVTDTGGNGADILVYAQAGLPPAGCAGAPGVNIKASAGETCFASGPYASTNVIAGQATGAGAVVTNVNEGQSTVSFSTSAANTPAVQADTGGSVTLTVTPPSTSATVTTTGNNSIGLYATGSASTDSGPVPSSISAQNVNVTTQGSNANGVQADRGGAATLNGGSVTVTGTGSLGLYATGAGSQINATDVAVSTAGSGLSTANAIGANAGAAIRVSGGSAATTGTDAYVVAASGGATVNLTGTIVNATGNGSGGLGVNGTGSTISATGLTITTRGNYDPVNNFGPAGFTNQSYPGAPGGGVLNLTDSSVLTTGTNAVGGYTANGGVTTISGGSISTSGDNALGIQATGAGSSVSISNGTTISTGGIAAIGVQADTGGAATLNGATVATSGQDAHAVYTTGAGSTVNLSGTNSFTTAGPGAIGVYAALGAVIAANGSSMTNVATAGGVSHATGLGAYGVNADGAGSKIALGAATITTSGPGAYALLASDAAGSGSAGLITATGTLNVKTTNPAATAVGLQGNNAAILATGGGTIVSAANAISFSGGANQTATFDNFSINTPSGDLVLADPSTSTINFNNTTASAGANPLLYPTGAGTIATFNANASTLTGTFLTGPGAISNVNLINGTTWNVTGPSNVTNLNVTNSVVVFAPPGSGSAFKTLTVTNYVGSGANIVMNASLGGAGSTADQIVVNSGKASGTSLITIKNIGGGGGLTSGSGIPLVTTTNGGTIAPNAFALASSPVVGGYQYSLNETNGDWYLASSPTTTPAELQTSVNNVAKAQQSQIITNRVLSSILLGATQQISCSSCGSGFGSLGSLAFGLQGRWSLSPNLTFIGGASYNQWSGQGIAVSDAPTAAGSLVYDFSNWGQSRPFFQFGGGITPYESVDTMRAYPYGTGGAVGYSTAIDRNLSVFGRAGWLARVTPIDEAAVYGDIGRNWMQTGAFTEAMTAFNPYPESAPTGLDTLNVVRLGGQWTHLFNGVIEVNGSGAVAHSFGAGPGTFVNIYDFGPIAPGAVPNSTWFEYGARIGYRVNNNFVVDAFLLGTAGGQVGDTLHGGLALRFSF